jgi:hypothetical protein
VTNISFVNQIIKNVSSVSISLLLSLKSYKQQHLNGKYDYVTGTSFDIIENGDYDIVCWRAVHVNQKISCKQEKGILLRRTNNLNKEIKIKMFNKRTMVDAMTSSVTGVR